jgi:epoxyqueuosine reductase
LAIAAGLGFQGKNNLLIAAARGGSGKPKFSSAVVLGLLVCPEEIDFEPESAQECDSPFPGCGLCERCIAACPSGALASSGSGFSRERCIQHWTSRDETPPGDIVKARGARLYGCDICLEACPYFLTDAKAKPEPGRLGPSLPVAYFLASEPEKIQSDLKKTALGPKWISKPSLKRFAQGLGR